MNNTEEQKKEAPGATGTSDTQLMRVDTFMFHDSIQLRTLSQGGQTWWVLADVCNAINLSSPHKVFDRLDEDQKGRSQIPTLGGLQEMSIVNEDGFWDVVLRSDKPEAKPFRKWITSEVLPALRKNGTYTLPNHPGQQTFLPRPGQQLLALPSPINPQVDCSIVVDILTQAARAAREIRPTNRKWWIREFTIGAYQRIYGADISAFLPQSDGAGLMQGSFIPSSNKVGVANGDTSATSTPCLPEPPPLRSLTDLDVIKSKKLEWWSMLKLQHVTGLNEWEILCCLYEGGAAHYHEREDSLIPNVFFKGTYYIKLRGQAYWSPNLVRMIDHNRPYLKKEWPIKWIARQENKMIVEGGSK